MTSCPPTVWGIASNLNLHVKKGFMNNFQNTETIK